MTLLLTMTNPRSKNSTTKAYVEWGKKMYYNQQGDTELEQQAENNFERIMLGKWRDQEIARMAAASDQAEIPRSSLV